LSWNAGETTAKTFDITIADDQVVDAGESFAVAISGPSGGATLGAPATASVSIADNDSSGGGGSTNSGGGGGGVVDLVLILAAVACLLIEARRSESLRAVVHGPRAAADA
jgi:hypothetical protein